MVSEITLKLWERTSTILGVNVSPGECNGTVTTFTTQHLLERNVHSLRPEQNRHKQGGSNESYCNVY